MFLRRVAGARIWGASWVRCEKGLVYGVCECLAGGMICSRIQIEAVEIGGDFDSIFRRIDLVRSRVLKFCHFVVLLG